MVVSFPPRPEISSRHLSLVAEARARGRSFCTPFRASKKRCFGTTRLYGGRGARSGVRRELRRVPGVTNPLHPPSPSTTFNKFRYPPLSECEIRTSPVFFVATKVLVPFRASDF
ncbi:hypothetical protein PUN28_007850 [Cardiocondyla obscurior]|uniref:Uncharacterized protein n=1 Tax=Cardiocondyla obscurior TaxID=286306 RepID=A0AAW2FW79_9HYME